MNSKLFEAKLQKLRVCNSKRDDLNPINVGNCSKRKGIEMKEYHSRNGNKNKIFVIFVAVVFLGSMAGAMLYSTGDSKKAGELPASKITPKVSDAQKERILFGSETHPEDRYVLITITTPKICDFECANSKRTLEQMVSAYAPAFYLSEVQSESDSLNIGVLMESYADKKELQAFNVTEAEDFICANTVYLINECVLREMNFGASNGNKTESNESREIAAGGNSSASNSTASNSTEQRNIPNNNGQQNASNTAGI